VEATAQRWACVGVTNAVALGETQAYERSRWPRLVPTLPDLLNYLMDQHDLSRSDLVPMLGTASRVSEVMNGKRELSMDMVRRLRERFNISAGLLIPRGSSVDKSAAA
jgi:HTH-type transcriptional regulator/antitoxin HigA